MTINLNNDEIVKAVTEAVRSQLNISQELEITFNPRKGGLLDATVAILSQADVQAKQAKVNAVKAELGIDQPSADIEPSVRSSKDLDNII